MLVAAIVDVRNPLEAGSEAAGNLFLADEATAPDVRASRRFEDAILCEVRHDRVEVVLVERVQRLAESLDLGFVAHEHGQPNRRPSPRQPLCDRYGGGEALRSRANVGSFPDVQEIDIG